MTDRNAETEAASEDAKRPVDVLVMRDLLNELEDLAMQNDLPIEDGNGYFGTGLPLRVLHEWIISKRGELGIPAPKQDGF